MARAKKDGKFLNIYLEKSVSDRLENYCNETGLTKTTAIERLLTQAFDKEDSEKNNKKKG